MQESRRDGQVLWTFITCSIKKGPLAFSLIYDSQGSGLTHKPRSHNITPP